MINLYENVDFTATVWYEEDGEIEESTLAELCAEYAEKTTTPLGVDFKYHLRNDGDYDIYQILDKDNGWEVWTWGYAGNHPRKIESFDSKDEAEHALHLFAKYDLDNGCDTPIYFYSKEELQDFIDENDE